MGPRSPTILRLLAPALFAVAAGCVKSEGTGVDTGTGGEVVWAIDWTNVGSYRGARVSPAPATPVP